MENKNDIEAAIAAGAAMAGVQQHEQIPFLVVPDGYHARILDEALEKPLRLKQSTMLTDLDSFIEYLEAYKGDGSAVFADDQAFAFHAVMDFHPAPGQPDFCNHQAAYATKASDEWADWTGADGKRMTQDEFAEFIENHLEDIGEPDGATMLEIAQSVRVKVKGDIETEFEQKHGKRTLVIRDESTTSGVAGGKEVAYPDMLKAKLRPFHNGKRYEVQARLRTRVDANRGLLFFFDLVKPKEIRELAFAAMIDDLRERTKLRVLKGAPHNSSRY